MNRAILAQAPGRVAAGSSSPSRARSSPPATATRPSPSATSSSSPTPCSSPRRPTISGDGTAGRGPGRPSSRSWPRHGAARTEPRLGRPGLRGLLPGRDPDRGALRAPLGSRPAARGRRGANGRRAGRARIAARHPLGLRLVPVAAQPARLVRPRHGPRGLGTRHGQDGHDPAGALPRVAVLRRGRRHRRAGPSRRPTYQGRRIRRALAPRPDARRIWPRIRAEYHRTVERPSFASPVGLDCSTRRRPPCSARSRCAIPMRIRCRSSRSDSCAGCAGPPADDPERDRLLRLVHLTVNGVAAALQGTG